ncbi:hypothetical protein SPOG_04987 [Schizosaccharomyces cryophilus OY26]|uniref:DNA 3'-5' helicase n=1 Tax=Schizosaccharomyces cryophilus (strain OY26 / ATCC MYA-4695 / CBS 11777 / NBRC 106824 / NRRL Y48691) TaxID=653667 RepID=S9X5U3_SCHCR|nr:uncharacterized protein SPOG_04987 [Schizosaccharomyces cryophilus OY26]EPY49161.1 hypothetical protein SPOG_04987 [Schizosaccharomyces cryophilus OY26]
MNAPYRIFPRVTYENIQKSLGFRNYRHIAHYFKERNIEEEGVRDSFFDMQAGHARSTALLIYGRTSDNLKNLPADFFTNFFRTSFRWQELLEIKGNSSGGFIIETCKPQNKIDQLLEKIDEIEMTQQRLLYGDNYENTHVVEKDIRGQGQQGQELNLNQAAVAIVPRTMTRIGTGTGTGTGNEEQQSQSNPSLYAPSPSPSPSMCPSQSTIRLCVYALSKFYGKPSKFRSMEQLQSVYFSYLKRVNLISVLATGSGKSLSFLLPAFIEKKKRTGLITVVLVPLISLRQDMARRANEARTLVCSNDWKVYKRTPPDSSNLPDMFILSYDSALTNEALCFFESLAANGRLARIVIDEAHSLLTDGSWRHVLWKASRLSGIAAPIILLSATFPRELEVRASETFCTHFQVIKTLTARKNIHYLLKQLDKEHFLSDLRDLMIRARVFEGNGRAIIFCRTKKNVEELRVKINSSERIETCAVSYTGDMAEEERNIYFNMFTDLESNDNRIMVATKAFGLGIDYPEVRLVMHYGSPSTSMDFAQETGRAGRDGKFSIAAMFYSKYEVSTSAYIDVRMKNFVEDKSMCVRSFLASEMDGQCSGCDFMPDYVVCSRCNPGLLDEREKEREEEQLSVEKDKDKDKDNDKDNETLTPTRKKIIANGSPPTPQSACSLDAFSADSRLMDCTISKDNKERGGSFSENAVEVISCSQSGLPARGGSHGHGHSNRVTPVSSTSKTDVSSSKSGHSETTLFSSPTLSKSTNVRKRSFLETHGDGDDDDNNLHKKNQLGYDNRCEGVKRHWMASLSKPSLLEKFFREFGKECISCFVEQGGDRSVIHKNTCPLEVKRCFRCRQKDHTRFKCPYDFQFSGACLYCGLTKFEHLEEDFPDKSKCKSWARGKLGKVAFFAWSNANYKQAIANEFLEGNLDDQNFFNFICQPSGVTSEFVNVVYFVVSDILNAL